MMRSAHSVHLWQKKEGLEVNTLSEHLLCAL